MTIVPPTEGVFDEPTSCLTVNQSWVSILLGLLEPGEKEWFWDSDVEDGQDGIREIVSALVLGNCVAPMDSYALIEETAAQNTNAGTFTSGDWRVRNCVTVQSDDDDIVVIDGGRIGIRPGTWIIRASAPAYGVNRHQCRLYNHTTSTVLKYGTSMFTNAADAVYNRSEVAYLLTVPTGIAYQVFELQHRCETSRSATGLGVAGNFAGEVYSRFEVTGRLA